MKICKKCNENKELSEFGKRSSCKDGHLNICKSCVHEQVKIRLNLVPLEIRKPTLTCKRCKVRKPRAEFRQLGVKISNGWNTAQLCLECEANAVLYIREKRKKRYWDNPELHISRSKSWRENNKGLYNEKRKFLKEAVITKLGGKCQHCSIPLSRETPGCCFDFHHLNPTIKEGRLSHMLGALCTISIGNSVDEVFNNLANILTPAVQAELDKCIVLCANCHRKVHTN